MGKFSLYAISLPETLDKVQQFEYHLDDKFFGLIEDSVEIRKGDLDAKVSLKHSHNEYELNFAIDGKVMVPCDRCLDDLAIEISTKNKLIVKFGDDYSDESDEIVIIPRTDTSINIAWFMYEFVALGIPMKHVHEQGKCNKAMSAKYNKHKAEYVSDTDDNEEDAEEDVASDSRWDTLKDMQFEKED